MLHNHTLPCKHPNKEWYKNVNSTCCGSRFLRSLFCWGDVLYWFLFWSFMSWRLLKNINTRSDFTLSFSFNRISTRNTVCPSTHVNLFCLPLHLKGGCWWITKSWRVVWTPAQSSFRAFEWLEVTQLRKIRQFHFKRATFRNLLRRGSLFGF